MPRYYDDAPPGQEPLWSFQQHRVRTREGSNYYTYGAARYELESAPVELVDRGDHVVGATYEADIDLVWTYVAVSRGGTAYTLTRKWLCIETHTATDATVPAGRGSRYWRLYEPGVSVGAAAYQPDAAPDAPPAPSTEEPAWAHGFPMDGLVVETTADDPATEDVDEGLAFHPDGAGEYRFGRTVGTYQALGRTWSNVRDYTREIEIADRDAQGNDQTTFLAGLRAGDPFHIVLGARWWIQFRLSLVRPSSNGRRFTLYADSGYTGVDERGALLEIPADTRVQFRFGRAAPTETAPPDTPAAPVLAAAAGTGALRLDWTESAGATDATTYVIELRWDQRPDNRPDGYVLLHNMNVATRQLTRASGRVGRNWTNLWPGTFRGRYRLVDGGWSPLSNPIVVPPR